MLAGSSDSTIETWELQVIKWLTFLLKISEAFVIYFNESSQRPLI